MQRVVVLKPHHFYQPYADERAAAARFGASLHAEGPASDALLREATVILSHSDPVDATLLDGLHACRLIVTYGTGIDHIDVHAAAARGIQARCIAGYCSEDVAEHALAMILSCARRLHQLDRAYRADGSWDVTLLAPGRTRLSRQTAGIVGTGRIGQALATKAAGCAPHRRRGARCARRGADTAGRPARTSLGGAGDAARGDIHRGRDQ